MDLTHKRKFKRSCEAGDDDTQVCKRRAHSKPAAVVTITARQHAHTLGYPDDWAAVNLQRLRALGQRPEQDTAAWLAGQAVNGVHSLLRKRAVNFLYHQAVHWSLNTETTHASVALLDRFLGNIHAGFPAFEEGCSIHFIVRRIAMTCMWLACKLLESTVPTLRDLVRVLEHTYHDRLVDADDLLQWECMILKYVDFNLEHPTTFQWLSYAALLIDASHVATDLAQYLLDVTTDVAEVAAQAPEKRAWAALWMAMAFVTTEHLHTGVDMVAFLSEARASVPVVWHHLIVPPAAVDSELLCLMKHGVAAHDTLASTSGVYLGYKDGGPWCTPAATDFTCGVGFPGMEITAIVSDRT